MTEDIPHEKRCVVCLNGEKEVSFLPIKNSFILLKSVYLLLTSLRYKICMKKKIVHRKEHDNWENETFCHDLILTLSLFLKHLLINVSDADK